MSSYGGGGGGAPLSDNSPQAAGIVSAAGIATAAARDDHVHVGMTNPFLDRGFGTADQVYVLPGWEDHLNLGVSAVAADEMYYCPIYIAQTWTFSAIRTKVTTAQASSLARMGIYNGKSHLRGVAAGSLLLDAGTVDTSTTGEKEIAISETLNPGWYFLVIINDTGSVAYEGFNTNTEGAPLSGVPEQGTPLALPKSVTFFKSGLSGVVAGGLGDPASNPGGYYASHKAGYVRLKCAGSL